MGTKALNTDQCAWLHQRYPPPDCCICNRDTENANLRLRVEELERGSNWGLEESKRVHGLLDAAHQRIERLEGARTAALDQMSGMEDYHRVEVGFIRTALAAGEQAGEPTCGTCGGALAAGWRCGTCVCPDDPDCAGEATSSKP